MELKKQVTNLELSMELEKLGVPQKSLFVWEYYNNQCHGLKFIPYAVVPNIFNGFKLFSAFTPAELGEMLHEDYFVYKTENEFCYFFMTEHGDILFINDLRYEETEVDAKARLLMYQIEKGLIKVEDLK